MSPRIVGSLVVPLLIFLVLLLPLADGFTDDGYIHIQYARNIVEHGEYSFNPGEVSFGTTSPAGPSAGEDRHPLRSSLRFYGSHRNSRTWVSIRQPATRR